MKIKRKLLIIIFLIVFLIGIVNIVNSINSKSTATNAVKEYILTEYSDLNLEIENIDYNFLFNSYMASVRDINSYDTAFLIFSDGNGKIIRDDYEYEVANKMTTWRRINIELTEIGNNIIKKNLPNNVDIKFSLENMSDKKMIEYLTLDMKVDFSNLPFKSNAYIYVDDKDVSYNKMAEILLEIYNICSSNNINMSNYGISIKDGNNHDKILSAYDIPSEIILSENLSEKLKKF